MRSLSAVLALVAVLFAQFSVAAYACPTSKVANASPAAACDEMDGAQPNLCEKHCHDELQSGSAIAAPFAFVAAFVATLRLPQPRAEKSTHAVGLAHAISPPQAVSHCRWRI
jgi:hypothetical protein